MAEGKVFAAKAFLLARILTILCCVVVVAVVAQVSGGGFVPDVGYFCHYSGPTGDFSRCDAVLALGIILLLVNCGLLVVQLFVHMEYPWSRVVVAVEAISTCLWLAISIVQVMGHLDSVEYRTTSDRDRIVVGMVFSFLAIPLTVINGLMFYASSAYDGALLGDGIMVQRYVRRLSSAMCWLAVEDIVHVGTFGFGQPPVIAAIVFSFFTIITLCGTCARTCITVCSVNASTSSGGDCDGSTTKETALIRLAMLKSISLILVIVCSLVILVSVAAYGEWYSEASSKGECIFGQSAVYSLLLSTSCLSLAIAIGLIIYLHLTGYKLSSVPITISTPMSILCFAVTIAAISSWNHGLPASSPTKQWGQGVQYNAGYSSCGTSLCLSLLWLVFVIVNACEFHGKHKGTFCIVEPGGADDYSRQWTGGEDPLHGFSGETAAKTGALAARRPLSFLSHSPTFRRRHANHCSVMDDCWEYVKAELNVGDIIDHLFNPAFDNCYCEDCHRQPTENAWCRGKELYIPPEGWCRFGLNPAALIRKYGGDEHRAATMFEFRGDGMSQGWPVAYHGTASKNIRSILDEGRLLAPGQRCKKSGKRIEIVDGHFGTGDKMDITNEDGTPFDWNRVFLSPSMRYCGAYCRDAKILLGKSHIVALQTRINPEAIVKSPETLNSMVLDNSVPRDELEWVIKDGSNAIIYGLLVRRSQCNL